MNEVRVYPKETTQYHTEGKCQNSAESQHGTIRTLENQVCAHAAYLQSSLTHLSIHRNANGCLTTKDNNPEIRWSARREMKI